MRERTKDALVLIGAILLCVWGMFCLARAGASEIESSVPFWQWPETPVTWHLDGHWPTSKAVILRKLFKGDLRFKEDACGNLTLRVVPAWWSVALSTGSNVNLIFDVETSAKPARANYCAAWFSRASKMSNREFRGLAMRTMERVLSGKYQ